MKPVPATFPRGSVENPQCESHCDAFHAHLYFSGTKPPYFQLVCVLHANALLNLLADMLEQLPRDDDSAERHLKALRDTFNPA